MGLVLLLQNFLVKLVMKICCTIFCIYLLPHLVPGLRGLPQTRKTKATFSRLTVPPTPGGRCWQAHGTSTVLTALQHPLEGGVFGPGFWTYGMHCAARFLKSPLQPWPETTLIPENKIPATMKRARVMKLTLKTAISLCGFFYEAVVLAWVGWLFI